MQKAEKGKVQSPEAVCRWTEDRGQGESRKQKAGQQTSNAEHRTLDAGGAGVRDRWPEAGIRVFRCFRRKTLCL